LLPSEAWGISLKFDSKGISFNIWLYFSGFAIAILLLFGILLNFLIRPYYRDDQMAKLDTLSSMFRSNLLHDNPTQSEIDELYTLVVNSNVCAVIYNDNGNTLYSGDSLGENCMFSENIAIDQDQISVKNDPLGAIDVLKEKKNLRQSFVSPVTGNEMLLYGKVISSDLVNYYLFINSNLEPMESVVQFIFSQFMFIAVIVIVIAFIVSFILARRISSPIVKIRKEANKLAEQNYDLDLPDNSFTEISELSTSLDDASKKLSAVNELRKDLVANVSHDIKTPLTMIKAYAEMIRDISGDDKEKREEHIDVILKESDYLNKLVTDMQELSKMEAGYIELNRSNFDLKEATEHVLSLLERIIHERNIIIVQNMASVVVYADQVKISQVIYNFVVNAIKHSPEGTKIEINTIDSEDEVRFEVKDYGTGISEKDLPYIWNRYYKIDKGFHRSLESSGLGLAIVKAILEAHHAVYGVESKLGEGSLFYFVLSKDYDDEV